MVTTHSGNPAVRTEGIIRAAVFFVALVCALADGTHPASGSGGAGTLADVENQPVDGMTTPAICTQRAGC